MLPRNIAPKLQGGGRVLITILICSGYPGFLYTSSVVRRPRRRRPASVVDAVVVRRPSSVVAVVVVRRRGLSAVLHRFTKAHQGDTNYAKIVPQRFKVALSRV